MSNPTFRLELKGNVTVEFTIHVDDESDPERIAEIRKSAEAALIQWSLGFQSARRSNRLFLIGQMADTLEVRFKTSVSAMIC